MVNTTLKEVTNPVAGQDADHVGGTDNNQMAQVLKGTHSTERVQSSSVQRVAWVTKSSPSQTLTNAEENVLADATSNAVSITLPTAVGNLNGHFCIKRSDAALTNLVTITTTSSQTIDGKTSITLRDRDTTVDLVSDGANWRIVMPEDYVRQNFRAKGATLNRYYSNEVLDNTAPITATVVAATMYALPLLISKTTTIDSVQINVTTLGAASSVNVGVYADNGNMYPGALIQDFGNQATATTGIKTFVTGVPITLLPGLYWLVFLCSATAPIVTGWTALSLPPILGISSALTGVALGLGWSVAQAAGPLPSTFTAGGAVVVAVPLPAVFWRTSG